MRRSALPSSWRSSLCVFFDEHRRRDAVTQRGPRSPGRVLRNRSLVARIERSEIREQPLKSSIPVTTLTREHVRPWIPDLRAQSGLTPTTPPFARPPRGPLLARGRPFRRRHPPASWQTEGSSWPTRGPTAGRLAGNLLRAARFAP